MAEHKEYSMPQLAEMLQHYGIRVSAQRIAVLEDIANCRKHPSAEEVYTKLSKSFHSLSRTTVYNSLHTLTEKGLLRELEIESGCIRYDIAHQSSPHSHFVCQKCGRITDMPMPDGIQGTIPPDYSIECVDVFIKGICPECSRQK